MANVTNEQLLEVIKILSADTPKEEVKVVETPKEEVKTVETPKEEAKVVEEEEPKEEEPNVNAERENKHIARTLKAGIAAKGIDSDLADSFVEFLSYDTLKNEAGEADEEKLDQLVDSLSALALRKPPKGGNSKRDILNSGEEGLGKYLPQNNK